MATSKYDKQPGSVNFEEDRPKVAFGPHVEQQSDTIPPFYVTLNVHDKLLHNCMLDYGASHNLMPKVVMETLGLDITRPYHELFSFDAKKVKCIGLIKDLVISLTQLLMKSVMIEIVMADIPASYGMLLSRAWVVKLGGNLQMDMSFATIPIFGGEEKRLYRETKLQYVVRRHKKAKNHPIYAKDESLGCFSLAVNPDFEDEEK